MTSTNPLNNILSTMTDRINDRVLQNFEEVMFKGFGGGGRGQHPDQDDQFDSRAAGQRQPRYYDQRNDRRDRPDQQNDRSCYV